MSTPSNVAESRSSISLEILPWVRAERMIANNAAVRRMRVILVPIGIPTSSSRAAKTTDTDTSTDTS